MNRVYRKIWNQSTGQVVVASELARAKGKGKGARLLQAIVFGGALALAGAPAAHGAPAQPPGKQEQAEGAVAMGFNAYVGPAANGSVAVGYGARATEAGVFSVGNGGGAGTLGPATRRIVNVSDGIADSDAATVRQVNAVASEVTAIAGAMEEVAAVAEHTDRYFKADGADDGSDDAVIDGEGAVAAGAGALSIGYQRALSDRATLTIGGAFSGDEKSVGLGAGFGW